MGYLVFYIGNDSKWVLSTKTSTMAPAIWLFYNVEALIYMNVFILNFMYQQSLMCGSVICVYFLSQHSW